MTAAQCFSKREVERLYPNILNLPHHHMVQKQTKQKLALKQMPLENSFFKIYTYTYHMDQPFLLGIYPREMKVGIHMKTLT